jgi:Fe2+ transport system protein B
MSGSLEVETRLQGAGGSALERAVEQIEGLLAGHYVLSKRAIALLLLQDDEQIRDMVKARDARGYEQIERLAVAAKQSYSDPLDYIIAMRRQQKINELLQGVVESAGAPQRRSRKPQPLDHARQQGFRSSCWWFTWGCTFVASSGARARWSISSKATSSTGISIRS